MGIGEWADIGNEEKEKLTVLESDLLYDQLMSEQCCETAMVTSNAHGKYNISRLRNHRDSRKTKISPVRKDLMKVVHISFLRLCYSPYYPLPHSYLTVIVACTIVS